LIDIAIPHIGSQGESHSVRRVVDPLSANAPDGAPRSFILPASGSAVPPRDANNEGRGIDWQFTTFWSAPARMLAAF
jgi:hypothetical protein